MRTTAHDGCSVLAVFSTSSPVLPPIFWSLITTSKKPSCSFSMAALPLGASSTSWPASAIACASPRRRESWSSAIRMRPMFLPQFINAYVRRASMPLLRHGLAAGDRQRHANRRSLSWCRPQVEAAVVRVHDLADDGEPEARPLRLGREEGIEDLLRDVLRNPRTVVDHFHAHRLASFGAV